MLLLLDACEHVHEALDGVATLAEVRFASLQFERLLEMRLAAVLEWFEQAVELPVDVDGHPVVHQDAQDGLLLGQRLVLQQVFFDYVCAPVQEQLVDRALLHLLLEVAHQVFETGVRLELGCVQVQCALYEPQYFQTLISQELVQEFEDVLFVLQVKAFREEPVIINQVILFGVFEHIMHAVFRGDNHAMEFGQDLVG